MCKHTHTQQVDKKIKKIVANIVLTSNKCNYNHYRTTCYNVIICSITSGKNHFHEMNGDVGMAGWK